MINNKRIGLALSGGGYRAAAFHLGTLNKLQEMQLLNKVDVLSTISGGSITGAAYCLHKGDYSSFHDYMKERIITKNVITNIFLSRAFLQLLLFSIIFIIAAVWALFTPWPYLTYVIIALFIFLLLKFQFLIFPVSKAVEKAYDKFLFGGRTLPQLNDKPLLAIGSSNLQTGRPFTFSRTRMGDSAYSYRDEPIYFKHEDFPIARAVMASSCVPFAFTPVPIHQRFYKNPAQANEINPQLVDGGVYDNQGIQKITQHKSYYECGIIITSDAGGKLSEHISFGNTIALLIRTVDVFMYRIKAVQMVQNMYQNVSEKHKPIAYFSLGWQLDKLIPGFVDNMIDGVILPEVLQEHYLKPEWVADPRSYQAAIEQHLAQRIGYADVLSRNLTPNEHKLAKSTSTNLTNLSQERTDCLIRHAENLAELQIKLYLPMILKLSTVQASPPTTNS